MTSKEINVTKICIFYSRRMRCKAYVFILALTVTFLTGCTSCSQSEYDFHTPEDALSFYQQYLNTLKDTKHSNTNEFAAMVNKWRENKDTVLHFLQKDSAFLNDDKCELHFSMTNDSIRKQMLRLSETWRYSYSDVLAIKEQTSSFKDDKELQDAVHQAEPFFKSLNEVPTSFSDKASILKRYRYFLSNATQSQISNKNDMLNFIRQEDFFFRSFLTLLYEMNNEQLSDITENTQRVCQNIFIAARQGKIPAKDVMVYMSMRTVRRLLQNAVICINDINRVDLKDKAQCNAYLWMIIQPFISISPFALATLTPEERSNFNYVMTQIPKSSRFAETFDIKPQALNYLLPQQLLKMYILSI